MVAAISVVSVAAFFLVSVVAAAAGGAPVFGTLPWPHRPLNDPAAGHWNFDVRGSLLRSVDDEGAAYDLYQECV